MKRYKEGLKSNFAKLEYVKVKDSGREKIKKITEAKLRMTNKQSLYARFKNKLCPGAQNVKEEYFR